MYELDNEIFSTEELTSIAEVKGYTLDELLQKNPNIKKAEDTAGKPTSQGPGAPVAETAAPKIQLTDTASPLVDGSLDFQAPTQTKSPTSLLEDGKTYRPEDVIEYEKSYATFQENRDSELRKIALKNNGIDIAAPAINENILKTKINQSLGDKKIASRSLPDQEYKDIFRNVFESDKYLSKDLPFDILKTYSTEIENKKSLIEQKYDLSSADQVAAANVEFSKFQNDLIKAGLKSNKTYQSRLSSYQKALGDVLEERKIEFDREALGLSADTPAFVEGLYKGFKQIGLSIKKSFDATEGETLQQDISERNRIQNLENNEQVTYGGRFTPNVGWTDLKSGTKQEALDFYDKKITEKKANLLNNIKENVSEEELQRAFKSANLEDGISFSDVSLLVGEQALQLPLAYFTNGVGVFAQEFGNSYFDNIDAYLDKNNLQRTPENMLAAVEAGEGDVAIATTVGLVNSALEKVGADNIAKGIFGETGKVAVKSLINDGFKKYITSQAAQQGATQIAKGGFVEFLTEAFQTASSQLGKGSSVDDVFGYIDTKEITESAKAGGIVGTILPFGGKTIKATARETVNAAKAVAAKFNPEATLNYLNLAEEQIKKSSELSAPEKEQRINAISEIRNANVKIPSFIKGDAKKEALDLIIEKRSLEKIISEADPNLVVEEKARIEEINKKIQDVAVKSKITELGEEDIAQAKKITEQLPELKTVVKDFNTTAELEEELKNQGKSEAEAKKLSDDFGFIVQKKDGTQEIYINKEISFDSGVATTAQHEVLHSVLKNLIPGNIALGQNLKDFVEEIAGDGFMGTEFSKRFESYELQYEDKINQLNSQLEKNEISEDDFSTKAKSALENMWEETMPLLSESLTRGDIDSKATIFEKLKDFFNRIFNTSNIKNVKFNTGEDVFNFIKDYNKIYKSGRGIKTLKNVVQGQVEGELISNKKAEIEEVVKSSSRELASDKVQKIYDEQGIAGIYEIMDEYKPMAKKIAEKYRDRPGFTTYKEDLVTSILDDPTYGVMGLALKYNPQENEGVPLAAYINKYLAARSITIANQLLGKDEASTFKSDVAEVKDVTATETAEDAILASEEIAKEKPVKKKTVFSDEIKFDEELSPEFDKTLIKAISLNIKKFDIETGKNRTVTPFVADLKKDIADFAEKDIVKFIKRQGLESFLIKNRELILNNYTTTFLSKHPFFRKGILKQVNGEWVAPTKISAYKYDWVDEKGNKLKIDRDNAAGRGMTSGPEIMKRNPRIVDVIKENEFVDYHFQDGALRNKPKQNPVNSLGRQLASEMGFEMIEKDIDQNGKLTETIVERADLMLALSAEKISEKVSNLKTDFGRGEIKKSIATKNYIKNNSAKISTHSEQVSKYLANAIFTRQPRTKSIWDNAFKNTIVDDEFKNSTIAVAEEFVKLVNNDITKKYKPTIKDIQSFLNQKFSGLINELAFTSMFGLSENSLNPSSQAAVDSAYVSLMEFANEYVEGIVKEKGEATKSDYVDGILESITLLGKGYANGNSSYLKRTKNLYDILENYLENKSIKAADFNIEYKDNYIFKDGEKVFITDSLYGPWQSASDISIDSNQIDISKLEMSKRNDQFNRANTRLDKIIKYIKNGIEKGSLNSFDVAVIMNSQTKHMATPLKMSYELKYFTYIKGDNSTSKFVYEHILPSIILARAIAGNAVGIPGFSNELIKNIRENAFVSLTQKSFDDILSKKEFGVNLQSSMPSNYVFGSSDVLLRYLNSYTKKAAPNLVIQDLTSSKIITHENFQPEEQIKASKSMNTTINKMIERKKGILASETISEATAKLQGAKKGKGKIFIPPSADDFAGLLYNFLGTGKQGDADMQFFEEKLLDPLARANFQLNAERQFVKQGYHNLIKANKGITKKLRKESDYKYYTNDAAVRVFMWTRLGYDIPGINAADKKALINAVLKDKDLLKFAEELISVPSKKESWLKPEDAWTASTIEMDLQEILSKIGRARIFEEYITNADIIFSKDNINKIEAAYGPDLRNALEDMLYRIEKGRAREIGSNKLANTYLNWVRGSVATTMFFNMRSALLQQLSIVNFTNWEDNNIFAQGKFIATQPKEYAAYWVKIFNSDWMKERRQGLKTDINESELVATLEASKNKNKALLAYMLEKGFSLTKYGDNIAVATGGAPFLYNREQKYIKEGMTEAKAKEKAFLDFQELAERTQQSSRQDLLSNQQVSVIGRIFLAFQNTTMQMTRIQKKAALDLINRRGSVKANVSKLVYYGAIQNTIFSFLQSALFAAFFTDDEEEKDELKIDQKTFRAINTVLDSALRGSGIAGAAVSTLKNALIAWMRENDKGFTGQNGKVILELLNISPAVGIKARKIYGAMENYKFNKKIIDKIGYDNPNHPYYGIAGNLVSAAFNVPLDRIITKASNIKAMTQNDAEAWQRTALFMGYNTWDLGLKDKEIELEKAKSKFKSKIIKPKSSSRKTPRSSRSSGRKSSR